MIHKAWLLKEKITEGSAIKAQNLLEEKSGLLDRTIGNENAISFIMPMMEMLHKHRLSTAKGNLKQLTEYKLDFKNKMNELADVYINNWIQEHGKETTYEKTLFFDVKNALINAVQISAEDTYYPKLEEIRCTNSREIEKINLQMQQGKGEFFQKHIQKITAFRDLFLLSNMCNLISLALQELPEIEREEEQKTYKEETLKVIKTWISKCSNETCTYIWDALFKRYTDEDINDLQWMENRFPSCLNALYGIMNTTQKRLIDKINPPVINEENGHY